MRPYFTTSDSPLASSRSGNVSSVLMSITTYKDAQSAFTRWSETVARAPHAWNSTDAFSSAAHHIPLVSHFALHLEMKISTHLTKAATTMHVLHRQILSGSEGAWQVVRYRHT